MESVKRIMIRESNKIHHSVWYFNSTKEIYKIKIRKAKYNKYMMKNKLNKISWIEIDNKINGGKFSKETIQKLHSCICNHTQIVNSLLTN